jgi:hypothetical protein
MSILVHELCELVCYNIYRNNYIKYIKHFVKMDSNIINVLIIKTYFDYLI